MFNDEGLGAAMAQHYAEKKTSIVEQRLVLLVRAMRGEFKASEMGTFEKAWAAIDPSTPLPPWERADG